MDPPKNATVACFFCSKTCVELASPPLSLKYRLSGIDRTGWACAASVKKKNRIAAAISWKDLYLIVILLINKLGFVQARHGFYQFLAAAMATGKIYLRNDKVTNHL
jgi:hypothetical protein